MYIYIKSLVEKRNLEKNIPIVALHNIDKTSYIQSLADVERQISAYKNIVRLGISNTIRQRFNITGDCFQIFDKRAGGVLFKDWEWELIPNDNPLKDLFETKINGVYTYYLDTDEGKMLRGADNYYYFLTHKGKSQNVDTQMVYDWAKNNINFIENIIPILPKINIKDSNDRRLLLGVFDNIRNISLIMLNSNIINGSSTQSKLLGLSNKDTGCNINKWSEFCQNVIKYMKLLCFSENLDSIYVQEVQEFLSSFKKNYIEDIKQILNNPTSINMNKSFRSYREIDNFIENYIAMNYALQKIKASNPQVLNRQINFIGATYGGLELPFIANEILNNEILMSAIVLQSKYNDRKSDDYLSKTLDIQSEQNLTESFNILGDDNVLTGKTLQSMINLLFSNEISINNVAIVRYPSINRVNQMFAEDSAIDTTKFFNYIQGLVFTSPYTKIKEDAGGQYLDALGVFNKDRRRLLEYLYKNGEFTENSEVAQIGAMYERR